MKKSSRWTQQEQSLLKKLREEDNQSWAFISKQMKKEFPRISKTSKQCRQRYINFILYHNNPQLPDSGKWSETQQKILLEAYLAYGSKWKVISQFLLNKSPNSIKNKFHSDIRKFWNLLNQFRNQKLKFITFKRMLDIFQISSSISLPTIDLRQYEELRINILKYSLLSEQKLQNDDAVKILAKACEFNARTKFLNGRNNCINTIKRGKSRQSISFCQIKVEEPFVKIQQNSY